MVTLAISETFPRIVKIAYVMAENMAPSERLANAALIAAAPDLLAALEAIVARFHGVYDQPALVAFGNLSTNPASDMELIAAAAIAKAKQ